MTPQAHNTIPGAPHRAGDTKGAVRLSCRGAGFWGNGPCGPCLSAFLQGQGSRHPSLSHSFTHPVFTDPTLHARLCPSCWGHSVNDTRSGSRCSRHRTEPLRPARVERELGAAIHRILKDTRARSTPGPWDWEQVSGSQPPILTPRANAPSTAHLSL